MHSPIIHGNIQIHYENIHGNIQGNIQGNTHENIDGNIHRNYSPIMKRAKFSQPVIESENEGRKA